MIKRGLIDSIRRRLRKDTQKIESLIKNTLVALRTINSTFLTTCVVCCYRIQRRTLTAHDKVLSCFVQTIEIYKT